MTTTTMMLMMLLLLTLKKVLDLEDHHGHIFKSANLDFLDNNTFFTDWRIFSGFPILGLPFFQTININCRKVSGTWCASPISCSRVLEYKTGRR